MNNNDVITALQALKTKLETTIQQFENNDDDGDGIVDRGHLTPMEQEIIDGITQEVATFKERHKALLEPSQNNASLSFEKPDETVIASTQDEATRKRKEAEEKQANQNHTEYNNAAGSITKQNTINGSLTWDSIEGSIGSAISVGFKGNSYSPIAPGLFLKLGFGLEAKGGVETGAKMQWTDKANTKWNLMGPQVNWSEANGEFNIKGYAELKGTVSIGLSVLGLVEATAEPSISINAQLDNKVTVGNEFKIEIGNLTGGINAGIEFKLGAAGWIAEALDSLYDGLSEYVVLKYALPKGEFLKMESKMDTYLPYMFGPTDVTFSKGDTLIALEEVINNYIEYLKYLINQIKNGVIEAAKFITQKINTMANLVTAMSNSLSDAARAQIKDLTIDSMTITLDDIHYDYGEEMDITIDLKLKDDDWFYNDTHYGNIWVELYYGETKIDGAEAFCSFKIKRQFQDTCTIKIPKNLDPSWANDDEAPEDVDDYIPPSNYINEKWGVCVYVEFNNNQYQQKEWENDNFFMWSA
ncbi:MAG: hypothetical protein MK212_03660 [Saprospiraceae bacterium]|nr:hypothetical protein [Saprospiraceae bacterium]